MALTQNSSYPGGSKGRVNRAGNNLRNDKADIEDMKVLDEWRAAHRRVLNTFQAILRGRSKNSNIIVAQRHKRKRTIFDKLTRYPKMELARMDDVAGCRVIFNNLDELSDFRENLHKAHFKHVLKNEVDKYDYIKFPKQTGYRGIHDVYSYNVNSAYGKQSRGLLIEVQYRTFDQHAWATAVEVVGLITDSQPKFERGDDEYLEIFRFASEIIARAFESKKSCLSDLSDEQVVKGFKELDSKLNFMRMLRGLNVVDRHFSKRKNAILIFDEGGGSDLEIRLYPSAPAALEALFELEAENPGKDIVLVRADTGEDVKIAFKNYFTDARDFIKRIDKGCKRLSGK